MALANRIDEGLRDASFAIDVVYDGAAALESTTGTGYDVVVLDPDLSAVHGGVGSRTFLLGFGRRHGAAQRRHEQVSCGRRAARRVPGGPSVCDRGAQVAALGDVAGVAQAVRQLRPRLRRPGFQPTLAGPPESHDGRWAGRIAAL